MNHVFSQHTPMRNLALEMFTPLARLQFAHALPWLMTLPRGDGHAVLVLPAMLADDTAMQHVSWFLRSRGYKVLNWGMGRNRGPRPGVFDLLLAKLKAEMRRTGQKTSIVGWSLGGTLARVLANRHPELVRSVVTLASPHAGPAKAGHAKSGQLDWLYTMATGHAPGSHASFAREQARTPDVPLTSVYTELDAVVPWRSSYQEPGPQCESVEVRTTHGAMATHPLVMVVLADRLSQREDGWQPFAPPWWFALANGGVQGTGKSPATDRAHPRTVH